MGVSETNKYRVWSNKINCQGTIYTAIYNKWNRISGIIRYQLISDIRGNTGRNNNIPELSN